VGLKDSALRSQRLRDSARGQQCTLQIPGVCSQNPETTVLAHLDGEEKGVGLKVDDYLGCFACSSCHSAIDGHKLSLEEKLWYEHRALRRTLKRWVSMGLLVVR
jgi:hypothetical protein